ncbi:MAG: fibronectin type III domain-containing protein [Paludibacteraceae bacterium]|nr:fibronectin type III domain-containing protein [Paludibacteraceae bacterium]
MKKIFSLLAAVLFAGAMMADSYTIEFKDNGTSSDGTSSMTSTTVADYIATGAEYVSAIEATGKVYNAQTGYGLKFGNSSNPGAVTLTLATPVKPTSIVMNASQWGNTEGSGLLQDSTIDMTAGGGKGSFNDYTYAYDGNTEITTIVVGTKTKRGFVKSVTVYYEGGVTPPVTLTEPAAAPAAPTYPANQVKAVYSATYNADCGFGEWGSGTAYTQETVGKKYVTTNLGYFGLEFAEHLNCAKMEKLHLDVWVAADASIRIVPIWGGAEQGIVKNLVGQQWNAVEIALTEFDQVTNWTDVYQIKIDNAANLTFWLNNVYFYTTVAPDADTQAPTAVSASLVSASYFSAKISATATDNSDAVIFVVKDGENELATAPAVSGVAKEITVNGLLPNTAYNFSVIAKDEAGNAAAPVAVAATTLAAPAPATAPTYAADKVLAIFADAYDNKLTEIQNWYAGPAISEGNLTATSKALCLEPNTTGGSCFGLAFAAVDASAYDALEMDVYATTEGSVLKTQAIGIGEAQTFNLVAGQWNHIVLNIKGNTKADLQQVGFYDCHNLTGVVFIQNVLFVDNDAPVTPQYEVAEAIAAGLTDDDEIMVRGIITKMEFKGKNFAKYGSVNIYVKDATGAEGEFEFFNCYSLEADTFKASVPAYDATSTAWAEFKEVSDGNGVAVHVGDTVIAFGKYKLYNTTYELNTGCYLVDIKHAAETPVEGDTIDVAISAITTPGALVWTDAVASAGWWQIMGETEDYEFSLSNVSTTETAGVYTIDDLDPDYSYITVMTATDTTDVTFVDGSVTVAVANDGTVTIVGDLVGDDGNVYHFDLTYADPKAERVANVTISNGTLYDGYASDGLYVVYGTADDNTAYVQLAIWAEEGFDGDFTEEDLEIQYVGSGVQDADGSHSIFSAVINVLPGDAEGVYSITADLLCYNNTLYKVSMSIGKTEGFENVDAAVKAIKRLVNGNVVIEKAGKKYNVNGAEL